MIGIPPELIDSSVIYESKYTNLVLDHIMVNGKSFPREVIKRPPAVVIVPETRNGTILMVKQWRHAAQQYLLEFPAGKVEEGMGLEETAYKELEEEVNFAAGFLIKLGSFFASPGYSTEELTVYCAGNLMPKVRVGDEDEEIEVIETTSESISRMIEEGKIKDSKTLAAFYLYSTRKI